MEMFIYIVSVVLAFGLGAFVGWNHMLGVALRTLGKVVPIEEPAESLCIEECELCGDPAVETLTFGYESCGQAFDDGHVTVCQTCINELGKEGCIDEIRSNWI